MQGINVNTEPNTAISANSIVVAIKKSIATKPRKTLTISINKIDSGVSENITPGNLKVKPPQEKISFTTLPHRYWLTNVNEQITLINIKGMKKAVTSDVRYSARNNPRFTAANAPPIISDRLRV